MASMLCFVSLSCRTIFSDLCISAPPLICDLKFFVLDLFPYLANNRDTRQVYSRAKCFLHILSVSLQKSLWNISKEADKWQISGATEPHQALRQAASDGDHHQGTDAVQHCCAHDGLVFGLTFPLPLCFYTLGGIHNACRQYGTTDMITLPHVCQWFLWETQTHVLMNWGDWRFEWR